MTAWAKRHISWLELQVVWLTLKHFLPQSRGAAVDVLSDNATTVAYINKEGRTHPQVSTWCREHIASHFSGSKNVLSDTLSRGKHHHPTEWSMHKVTVALIFEHWPTPHVDLFAFEQNQVSFSAGPSPLSSGSNALIQNWEHLYGYSFPPLSLIPRKLRKQVAAVSPYPIDGAVLAQSTVVTSADEHAGGPPMGDLVPGPPPEELGHGNVHVDLFAFEQNQVFFSAGQPPEELGHRNVLPCAGYLYGLPPRILC